MQKLIIIVSIALLILACTTKNRTSGEAEGTPNLNQETMSTEILGLRTCAYMVADLAKAKEWYTEAFNTKPYFDEPFYVGFNVGGYELALMPEENPPASKSENVLTYWGVNDIQAVYENLLSLGAVSHEEPTNYGGDLMVASVKDPWGNLFGIIYNPYFKVE